MSVLSAFSDKRLLTILLVGLIARVVLNAVVHSHDAVSFVIWAKYITENGVVSLYENLPGGYPPYPPFYYYVLAPVGKFLQLFGLYQNEWLALLIVKIPVFTVEVFTTLLIYLFTNKYVSKKHATFASAFYFLNPTIVVTTAVWGQIDSVVTGLVFASLFFLVQSRLILASAIFFAGLFLKLQTFAALPLFLLYLTAKAGLRKSIYMVFVFTLFGIFTIFPMIVENGLRWTLSLFYHLPSQYPYTSVYAYNIFSVFGFMAPDSREVLGVSLNAIGLVLFSLISVVIIYKLFKTGWAPKSLVYSAFLVFFAFFLFNTRMHSRYLIYTIGFMAPFAARYPKVALALSLFCILNLLLPMTSNALAPIARFLGRSEITVIVLILELAVFAVSFVALGKLKKSVD